MRLDVDIWSDVVCPFCYMGKRRFETALARFAHRDSVKVVWHSFQLDPEARFAPGQTVQQYLAERKGIPFSASRSMHDRLTAEAADLGLAYDFDAAVIANTFDAHRLTHLAKERGLQERMEERLFAAYFTEGKNIADHSILADLAARDGLDREEALSVLGTVRYADAVRADVREAHRLGADGVPFYVFNRAYAVSGAQQSDLFLEVLRSLWEQLTEEPPAAAG